MGQIFSNLIGTCNCSSNNEEEYKTEEEIHHLKNECEYIKARLVTLETASDSKYNLLNQKIENVELKIAGKLNVMNEKFSRLEDKIDTKFDLIMITMNQNKLK